MKFNLRYFFFFLFACLMFTQNSFAQTDCQPPKITANANAFNIFDERQETDLGDAMAERFRKNFRVIDDEQVNDYLQSVGDRIVKHLPQTNLKFQFVITDLPYANAFNMSGGRIYVTRKLLAFVRSEDELAGVLAHELGHGVVHHATIDASKLFKEILGVAEVGDRRDIFEKYNRLIDNQRTKRVNFKTNHEDNQQLEADRIGIFATTAAGYDANGLISFLDRLTESKGKTGNFFTDLFGTTKPAQKRLREMIEALKTVPAACFEKRAAAADKEKFEKWRSFVIAYSGLGGKEQLNAVVSRRTLAPPLRTDVEHLRFSPNGEYILAQDDSGISVLKREPFTLLFRIEAPEVKLARFTPDSQNIVFYNTGLRVQKWSIAEKSAIAVNEVVLRRSCWQTELSPDGNTLACFNYSGDLGLYDVATNENIFLEKQFYLPNYFEYFLWLIGLEYGDDEVTALNMQFSPNGRYFVAGRKPAGKVFANVRLANIGVDVTTRKTISLGENVEKLLTRSFAFYTNDKIIGQSDYEGEDSGVFAFPGGERIEKMLLVGKTITRAEQGDYLLVRPVSNAPVGVYDVRGKKFILANKTPALDVYGDSFVAERKNGELGIYKFTKGEKLSVQETAVLELPPNQFGALRTVGVSPDGKWLAASEKSRGAVWNLETGERVMYLLGFRGSHFGANNLIYVDFPKNEQAERSIISMNPNTGAIEPVNQVTEKNTRQYGQFLVSFKSNNKEKPKEEPKKESEQKSAASEEESETVAFKDVTMEVRDTQSNASLWTRRFDEERPYFGFNRSHGTLTLLWALKSKAAKNIIRADAALSAKLAAMQEKEGDYFFQIVEPATGKITGQFLLETGEGSFGISSVYAAGDNLIVSDTANRILIYSISKGTLRQRFFGGNATISLSENIIAIENEPGRLTIYDLTTGAEREKLRFGKPISFAQFNADGKRLFVLTANQTAFMLDATKFGSQPADRAKN